MNITLFNKLYWVRRFSEQKLVKGYLVSTHEDFAASLHIHPGSTDQIYPLPEGQRRVRRLQGHGTAELVTADESCNQKGDLLYYKGRWYECINSQEYDHTILCHYNYDFVLVPTDAAGTIDLTAPDGEPTLSTDATDETETGVYVGSFILGTHTLGYEGGTDYVGSFTLGTNRLGYSDGTAATVGTCVLGSSVLAEADSACC